MATNRWTGFVLIALGFGLAANSLLGPLALGAIRYRYSHVMESQGIGLDFVSLVLVAPLCVVAGVLVVRGHRGGAVLAMGPALYAAYMLPQYVVGPEYLQYEGNNERWVPFHLALFIVSVVAAFAAWRLANRTVLPAISAHGRRWLGGVLIALCAFLLVGMYFPRFLEIYRDGVVVPDAAEYRENPHMFWIVVFLDLGVVMPAAGAAGGGVLRGAAWAQRAMYAIIGWFAFVGPSVAAMGVTMLIRDDADASLARTVPFIVYAVVFAGFAVWLYRPLFARSARSGSRLRHGQGARPMGA